MKHHQKEYFHTNEYFGKLISIDFSVAYKDRRCIAGSLKVEGDWLLFWYVYNAFEDFVQVYDVKV